MTLNSFMVESNNRKCFSASFCEYWSNPISRLAMISLFFLVNDRGAAETLPKPHGIAELTRINCLTLNSLEKKVFKKRNSEILSFSNGAN